MTASGVVVAVVDVGTAGGPGDHHPALHIFRRRAWKRMIDAKLKHLEFIQGAINRMATTSFVLKGWAITIVGGLLALTFKEINTRYLYISAVVLLLFWLLDAIYLAQERNFVRLYEKVRRLKDDEVDFSMDANGVAVRCGVLRCAFSKTILAFYGGLLAVHLLVLRFI